MPATLRPTEKLGQPDEAVVDQLARREFPFLFAK
jgi:hypothetical protein